MIQVGMDPHGTFLITLYRQGMDGIQREFSLKQCGHTCRNVVYPEPEKCHVCNDYAGMGASSCDICQRRWMNGNDSAQ